jgi:RNA 3'-terminal phosphate cyclase (ATP)
LTLRKGEQAAMISIDGSMGEGGGQIVRSALSLALLTGKGFTLTNIRAARATSGLRAQHLAAVNAAARISHAIVDGARVGSQQLTFAPGTIAPGHYHFDIGTAGATSLVLQTVLLPLALADEPSQLTITGGTHVPWSPCFHYLDWHWRVMLARMGISFELSLQRAGFYPEGGGEMVAMVHGRARPHGIDLTHRGELRRIRGLSAVANLSPEIAERQRRQVLTRMCTVAPQVDTEIVIESFPASSRGTVVVLLAEFEESQACFAALGARGKPAERVADEAVNAFARFLQSDGAIDPWLADQLLLPLAVTHENGKFRTSAVTRHLLTNAQIIRYFLPVEIDINGQLEQPSLVSVGPV